MFFHTSIKYTRPLLKDPLGSDGKGLPRWGTISFDKWRCSLSCRHMTEWSGEGCITSRIHHYSHRLNVLFSLDMSCVQAGGKYMRKYNMAEEDEWVCKYGSGTHLHNNKKLSIKYKELLHTCIKAHKTISYVCQTWFLQKNSIISTLKSLKWQLIPLPLVFSTRIYVTSAVHTGILTAASLFGNPF